MRGGMRNLSLEARETDLRIRIDLGLPMVDDAEDFLGACAEAIEDRDEEITDLRDKLETEEAESSKLTEENKELQRELATANFEIEQLQKRLKREG